MSKSCRCLILIIFCKRFKEFAEMSIITNYLVEKDNEWQIILKD